MTLGSLNFWPHILRGAYHVAWPSPQAFWSKGSIYWIHWIQYAPMAKGRLVTRREKRGSCYPPWSFSSSKPPPWLQAHDGGFHGLYWIYVYANLGPNHQHDLKCSIEVCWKMPTSAVGKFAFMAGCHTMLGLSQEPFTHRRAAGRWSSLSSRAFW